MIEPKGEEAEDILQVACPVARCLTQGNRAEETLNCGGDVSYRRLGIAADHMMLWLKGGVA